MIAIDHAIPTMSQILGQALDPSSWALVEISDITTRSLYLGCAIAGGAVLSIQMLLLFLGGDVADGEVDADGGGDGVSFFSIRAVASFMAFFGLVGLYGQQNEWTAVMTAGCAVGAGIGMMLAVAWLFSLQSKLHQEGTMEPTAAVGRSATVYLRIPAGNTGKGKITVALQGRTAEYAAVTEGPELATGSDVTIVRMVNNSTFEVAQA